MPLLSFQRPAHAACIRHIHKQERVKWEILQEGGSIPIHPPLVVNGSVSSGKSVMIAELAKAVKDAAALNNKACKVLVLQRQGELADQNAEAGWQIGLQNSAYSASLGRKSVHYDVVFATEGTCARALEKEFATWVPNLILVDECHMLNFLESSTQFATILLHFYALNPSLRVIGYTGSPFRDIESIIGEYWRGFATIEPGEEGYPEGGVGNGIITTEFMIAEGWVVPPMFGWPDHEEDDSYDFSGLKTNNGSWEFNEAELDMATSDIDKLVRIMVEVVHRSEGRKATLIFGATHKHIKQIKAVLIGLGVHSNDVGIITESTGKKERKDILERAKRGKCKYTLNVGVLTTGVNVPMWDTLVYLRPIGSLVLLIQSIGRVLRLLLEEGGPGMLEMDAMTAEERLALIAASPKPNALILDYGGVMDRLGSQYENPLLEQAQKEHATRKNELIECPACHEMNSMYARRCIGVSGGHRCEYFFQSKQCPDCGTKNDIVARACRDCGRQLIDPNEALSGKHYTDAELTPVVSMTPAVGSGGRLNVNYVLSDGREVHRFFYPNVGSSPQMKGVNTKVWYNEFVKIHIPAGKFRDAAYRMTAAQAVKSWAMFNMPTHISARYNEDSKRWTIGRVKFRESGIFEAGTE